LDIEEIKGSTVLIVDDNPSNLGILFNYLGNSGLRVLLSEDGKNALEMIREEKPDLLLLDILMSGIDGYEICKKLKSDPETKDIPIIFISALSETIDKVKGFQIGAVDYITKPFQNEEVLARISAHLTIVNQRKKLSELNERKNQLISIISHDLKSPFSSMINNITYLIKAIESKKTEIIKENLKLMHDFGKRIYALIENLLDWAKMQDGKIEFYPEQLNLYNLTGEIILLFDEIIKEKEINLSNSILPDTMVKADRNMLSTIIRNLILNAVKFTNLKGDLKISTNVNNGNIKMSITNTGPGITKDNLEKLFKISARFKTAGTIGERGSGLGLMLCKEFVEKHNGTIDVVSELNDETTFSFILPADNN